MSTFLVWTSQVVPTYLPILTVKNIDVHSIVSTYICKIFIALTVFAINLTCILCTLSYNMTLSIANYETAKSKSHHVCRWQWFCRKKGRRGHFPKCPKQHKTFMYLERNSHHLFKGPSINNVITLPKLLDTPTLPHVILLLSLSKIPSIFNPFPSNGW